MSGEYKLGLDLGTASIGAVALGVDDSGEPVSVPWHSVRIFSEPNEKSKTGLLPKKAGRRQARMQRRQIDRRAARLRKIAHLAHLLGLEKEKLETSGIFPLPEIRAKAASERVELDDVLRIFLRMAKRRGYKGEFRVASENKDTGVVQAGSSALQAQMNALAEQEGKERVTLGEFLQHRIASGLPSRLKLDWESYENLYALRGMLEDEFRQIWATQSQYHAVLKGEFKGQPLQEVFFEALFYQRPLKSPVDSVGKCSLEVNLPRAPRAQMAAQVFRIEKTIADLRWGMGKRAEDLSWEQKAEIRRLLSSPAYLKADGEISFKDIYKALEAAGCPRPNGRALNLERESREYLLGNTTLKTWSKLGLLEEWQALSRAGQIQIVNFLADLGSPEQLDRADWMNTFAFASKGGKKSKPREFSTEFVAFINQLRVHPKFGRISSMGFDGGRSAYSIKALEKLSLWLQEPEWPADFDSPMRVDEEGAIRVCYPKNQRERAGKSVQLLPPPLTGNDTVDVALNQLRHVVQQAMDVMGCAPQEIIIEMSREMGQGVSRRNEYERQSSQNQTKRKKISQAIEAVGVVPTSSRIIRYQLWEEQEKHCPYCTRFIGDTEALDGSLTHIEHILPRSLTQVGRKRSELVLAHASCNHLKGDRTPYQAFGGDVERWEQIVQRANRFAELGKSSYRKDRAQAMSYFRKAKLLVLQDFENEVLNDDSIADFADRQLHQTSWIAKAAAQWLNCICDKVYPSRGELTAMLRRSWRLETVIPQIRYEEGYQVLDTDGKPVSQDDFQLFKAQWEGHALPGAVRTDRVLDKRLDHRHHLIDALTIALTSRSLFVRMAKRFKEEGEAVARGEKRRRDWAIEPPLRGVRDIALGMVRQCNLSHKPDRYAAGAFFEDTAYGVAMLDGSDRLHLAKRTALTALVDEKSEEKTRKNINAIVSTEVRALVLAEFEKRLIAGALLKGIFNKPVLHPLYASEIRKVKIAKGYAENAIRVEHHSRQGEHYKYLVSDSYAFLEVRGDGKNVEAKLITQFQAAQRQSVSSVGEDGSKTRRFYKGDTVTDVKDGRFFVVTQFFQDGAAGVVLVPIVETRPVKELSGKDGLRKVSGKSLMRLSLVSQ